jgi:divalent metal cation (Fe/Co/Zn/Cd) transporter
MVLMAPAAAMILKGAALLASLVSAGSVYVAIALPTLLRSGLAVVNAVIALLPATAVLAAAVAMVTTGQLQLLNPIVSIAIAAYLYANVKRLAGEAAASPPPA